MARRSPSHAYTPELVALGAAIRASRKSRGMSQEDLANASSLDRSYMGGLERGEHNPTLMTILRLASTLGVKASTLLSDSGL